MKYRKLFAVIPLILPYCVIAQLPAVVSGKIVRVENFESKYVTARNVDIWLPEGYNGKKKFAVLYMHDGQMLYDSAGSWNKQSWDVDDVVTRLAMQKKIRDVIVVGVWNGGPSRHPDYFPQKPFESLTEAQRDGIYQAARANGVSVFGDGKIQSDNYLKFLVTELKPYIDNTFTTRKDRKNTFVAGSSMGGLISMYALCEYPDTFGGAACLSTHWPGIFSMENNPIPDAFVAYLQQHLPDPKTHKLYFDYGTETLDALYPPLQQKVDAVMKSKGWTSKNWMTREFKGEDHSERAWRKRLEIPLIFLLSK
jgi:enterochelin esterase-like enzyme